MTVLMADRDRRDFRLGTPAASIVGMTQKLLERDDLDEDLAMHLRAIRELALELAREAERNGRGTRD
jgi:hypothetical protein